MSDRKNSHKKLFFNASWLFGGKAAAGIFGAIQTIIVARVLGVSDYGLIELVIAYIAILNQFFDFRVWETATKYIGTFWEKGELDKTRSMIKLSYILDISSGVLAFVIAIISAKLISSYFLHSPEAYVFIWIYAVSLLIDTANSTSDAILRVFSKFKTIAYISSSQKLFRLIVVVSLLFAGLGIKGVLFGFILASFLGFAVRMWMVIKTLEEKELGGWLTSDISLIRDQWRGIAWFLGNTSFLATLKMGNDKFIGIMVLGFFAGKEAVAFYKIASQVSSIVNKFVDPLYEAIYPELVKFTSADALKEFKNLIKDSTKSLLKIIVPITIVIIIFSEPIVNLIFGADYVPASGALRIIAVAVLIARLTYWINPALMALDRPGLRTVLVVIATAVYMALLFILVPPYSYFGAAYAFLGFAVVKSALAFYIFGDAYRDKVNKLADSTTS